MATLDERLAARLERLQRLFAALIEVERVSDDTPDTPDDALADVERLCLDYGRKWLAETAALLSHLDNRARRIAREEQSRQPAEVRARERAAAMAAVPQSVIVDVVSQALPLIDRGLCLEIDSVFHGAIEELWRRARAELLTQAKE